MPPLRRSCSCLRMECSVTDQHFPNVHVDSSSGLLTVRAEAAKWSFQPSGTMRCIGTPLFRNLSARHLGCLLDVDNEVASWTCLPIALKNGANLHVPDFLVQKSGELFVVDALLENSARPQPWIAQAAAANGYEYAAMHASEFCTGFRLQNAMDLLRYARWQCPLGDRIRLLAALEEHASLSVSDCFTAFQETQPAAGLSSLILNRFVEVDLDEALIGPETSVRRWRG